MDSNQTVGRLAGETVEVVPVVEERLTIAKRLVEGEGVRVRLVTDEVEELARISLRSERIEVERVPVRRVVEQAPAVEENGVTVIPVLEEVVVTEKQLVLKEELHVRRVADTREKAHPVTLRRQRAEVEGLPPAAAEDNRPGATPPSQGRQGEQA